MLEYITDPVYARTKQKYNIKTCIINTYIRELLDGKMFGISYLLKKLKNLHLH